MIFKLKILYYFLKFVFRRIPKNRKSLSEWQDTQIKKLIKRITPKSVFYQKQLSKYKEWNKLPHINKTIMMGSFNEINTVGIDKDEAMKVAMDAETSRDFTPTLNGITIGLSSGTSGNRGIFLVSDNERAKWVAYVIYRAIKPQSLKKKKIALFLRANSNLYSAIGSYLFNFDFFDLKKDIKDLMIQLLSFNPDVIVAQPSMLIEIAKKQQDGSIRINPYKIISVAEVLEEKDKLFLQSIFKQTILQAYQCTEGFLAYSCDYGVLHFNEDVAKIERKYIDDTNERYHPIITDFTRFSQPIIRYELNDIIIDKKGLCECGSHFQAIEKIEGRADDVFYLKKINSNVAVPIFPDFIRRTVIAASDHIMEYIVKQVSETKVEIYLNVSPDLYQGICEKLRSAFERLFTDKQVLIPEIVFFNEIPATKDSKLRRVVMEFFPDPEQK